MPEYAVIGFFTLFGSLFVGGGLITSKFLASRSPENPSKRQPYECGENAIGSARIQFKVGYYLFALIFLVFDVEALFLFPCMAVFKKIASNSAYGISGTVLISEILIFVLILGFGLVYAWKKKVLEWE